MISTITGNGSMSGKPLLLLLLTGCGVPESVYVQGVKQIKKEVQEARINSYATDVSTDEVDFSPYVQRFIEACGLYCTQRTIESNRKIDFLVGNIQSNIAIGLAVSWNNEPLPIKPNNFIIIDRDFWFNVIGNAKLTAESKEASKYRIVAHEMAHILLDANHRDAGLMRPTTAATRFISTVNKLVQDEVKFIEGGGKYEPSRTQVFMTTSDK